jgi:hypothetical protein
MTALISELEGPAKIKEIKGKIEIRLIIITLQPACSIFQGV